MPGDRRSSSEYLLKRGQQAIAARRDKRGYPTPANEWMAVGGGALPREILLDRDARIGRYVRREQLGKLIDRHAAGSFVAGDQIYAMVAADWLQECVGATDTVRAVSSAVSR